MDGGERGVGDFFGVGGEVGLAIDFSDAQRDADLVVLVGEQVDKRFEFGEFFVHALDKKVAEDLQAGEMEDRIAHVYMEADHIYVQDVLDVAPIFGALKK